MAWIRSTRAAGRPKPVTRASRKFGPCCGDSVKAMSMRSAGSSPAARSGHSSSMTVLGAEVIEAELGQFRRPRQPVEVGMHQVEARQLIGLHQREGRARHFHGLVAGEMADQGAREGGLAGAEIAGQRDQVARLDQAGDVGHQAARGLFVGRARRRSCSWRRGKGTIESSVTRLRSYRHSRAFFPLPLRRGETGEGRFDAFCKTSSSPHPASSLRTEEVRARPRSACAPARREIRR